MQMIVHRDGEEIDVDRVLTEVLWFMINLEHNPILTSTPELKGLREDLEYIVPYFREAK